MNSPFPFSIGKYAPNFISRFDSATDMVGALSSFLKGEDFEGVGATPSSQLYAKAVNMLPGSWKQKLYTYGGISDASSYKNVEDLEAEEIDKWVYNVYPKKKYPAIAIGSSNGAMVHLCAALGIPWLPQTALIPIKKGKKLPVDEPKETIEWAEKPAEIFLQNNPDWQLHHMMDPCQDRLRVSSIAYFRVKKLRLGKWYRKFIDECLEPGGSLIVIDCQLKWPTIRRGERHYFQFGGLGSATPEDYYEGSEKVRSYLQQQQSDVRQWDVPEPDTTMPEAEWGMENSLLQDVKEFAAQADILLSRLSFEHPQDMSPVAADLYRWWYAHHQRSAGRLLVESFTVQAPLLTIRTGSIPYWLFFNVDAAADKLEKYLQGTAPFEEIFMMILSHGNNSIGLTPISRWRSIMSQARKKSEFIGMDPDKYPLDFGVYARYSPELEEKVNDSPALPPLKLKEFNEFMTRAHNNYNVSFATNVLKGEITKEK